MSRGLGRIERQILDAMKQTPNVSMGARYLANSIADLAGRPRHGKLSPALRASVYRAIKSLAQKRMIAPRVNCSGSPTSQRWMLTDAIREEAAKAQAKAAKEARRKQRQKEAHFKKYGFKPRLDDLGLSFGAPAISANGARMAKLLGMLRSDNPNEALAAVQKIEALRRKLGVEWEQLLR